VLDAQEQPNWQELIKAEVAQTGQIPQQPDPKLLEMQMKGQLEQQKIGLQSQAQQHRMQLEERDKAVQLAMKQQEHEQDMQHRADMANISAAEAVHKQRIFSAQEQAAFIQKLMHADADHQQKMAHADEAAKQKAKEPKKEPKK
jgi:hypothetical protein